MRRLEQRRPYWPFVHFYKELFWVVEDFLFKSIATITLEDLSHSSARSLRRHVHSLLNVEEFFDAQYLCNSQRLGKGWNNFDQTLKRIKNISINLCNNVLLEISNTLGAPNRAKSLTNVFEKSS